MNTYIEASTKNQLELLAYLVLAFVVSASLAIITSRFVSIHFENKISELRGEFSLKILRSNFERAENNTPRFVPVLVQDFVALSWFGKNFPDAMVAIFQVIGVLVYMITLSWQMTIAFISIFVLAFGITFLVFPLVYRTEKKFLVWRNKLYAIVEGLSGGLKDLTMNQDHKKWYVEEGIKPVSKVHGKMVANLNILDVGLAKTVETFVLIALGLAIYFLREFSSFEDSQFLQFLTVMLFILPAFIRLSTFFKRMKKAEVALEQIQSFGVKFDDSDNYQLQEGLQIDRQSDQPLIALKDVKYTYLESEHQFIVGPFLLDVFQNEILLIRGGNGSGKTTLAKVITGLYLPQEGAVELQGEQIKEDNLLSYRNQFSTVFTDSHVFDDLNYIRNKAEEAKELLEELQLTEKVNLSEMTISNTKLSFGQMGRLNLFRTILEDKPILLLDEWAANQDPHFKEKFYLEIIPRLKAQGKTIILISHDDHYYHIADRIIKMRMGAGEEVVVNSPAV